jgi:membrane protein implicated in regulation of membrane protease activity
VRAVHTAGVAVIDLLAALPTWLQCLMALGVVAFLIVLVIPYLKRLGEDDKESKQ